MQISQERHALVEINDVRRVAFGAFLEYQPRDAKKKGITHTAKVAGLKKCRIRVRENNSSKYVCNNKYLGEIYSIS